MVLMVTCNYARGHQITHVWGRSNNENASKSLTLSRKQHLASENQCLEDAFLFWDKKPIFRGLIAAMLVLGSRVSLQFPSISLRTKRGLNPFQPRQKLID